MTEVRMVLEMIGTLAYLAAPIGLPLVVALAAEWRAERRRG